MIFGFACFAEPWPVWRGQYCCRVCSARINVCLPAVCRPFARNRVVSCCAKRSKSCPARCGSEFPSQSKPGGARFLGLGYGITFGVLYSIVRPSARKVALEGTLLGLAAWAAGYLGWLPATGLMPPIWKHRPAQVALPVAEHALYGVATVVGYQWLSERASRLRAV